MEDKIKEILAAPAYRYDTPDELSLYSGSPGYILLACQYSRKEGCDLEERAVRALEQLTEHDQELPDGAFAGGKAGVHWLYSYLFRSGFLEEEDYDLLCSDKPLLQQYALNDLASGNWDFLYGGVGVAYALLFHYKEADEPYFQHVFRELKRICEENEVMGIFPGYDYKNRAYIKEEVDLGLAHGLPSVLKFCVQCYKQGVCVDAARSLADRIIDFLLAHTNPDKTISYFSAVLKKGEDYANKSRLGWCYGDLGIGIILYQAAGILSYPHLADLALAMLKHSTLRRTPEDTDIWDAGICHGSAGVAHIYNRMWHYTQDIVFKEAAAYWIQKTIDFALHENGVAGYKSYTQGPVKWVTEAGLLEGAAGIGLVMLSYLTGDFSWDYCLMLND